MNEGDFVLNSIAEQGKAANADFERRLKAAPPLEVLLDTPDEADELQKLMDDIERSVATETNPYGDAGRFDITKAIADETPIPTIEELERKYSANPWGKAAQHERVTAHQDEEEETDPPELPEQTGARYEREVQRMASSILCKMQTQNMSKASAVETLRGMTQRAESLQIIEAAAERVQDA